NGTAPSITVQPRSQTNLIGGSVVFSVSSIGSPPLSYQWRSNDVDIAGATNAALTLMNLSVNQSGGYSVVVSNAYRSVTSAVASLVVLPCVNGPSGIVAWWRAENNALDSVGANHGMLTNSATFAPGKVGEAFSFEGTNDFMEVPNSP